MSDGDRRFRESFVCAPGMRIEAHEQLTDLRFAQIANQLSKVEDTMERLERRLWLTVYGVVGVILSQAIMSIIEVTP